MRTDESLHPLKRGAAGLVHFWGVRAHRLSLIWGLFKVGLLLNLEEISTVEKHAGYYRGCSEPTTDSQKDVLEHGRSRLWTCVCVPAEHTDVVREPRSSPFYARTSIELDGRAAGRRQGGLATRDGALSPPCHSGSAPVRAVELVTGEGGRVGGPP